MTPFDQFHLEGTDIGNVSVRVLPIFVNRARLRYGTRNEVDGGGRRRIAIKRAICKSADCAASAIANFVCRFIRFVEAKKATIEQNKMLPK